MSLRSPVSDSSSQDPSSDTSGPLLRTSLDAHPSDSFRVIIHAVIPDDPGKITSTVRDWIDNLHVALVITTGGTGFGVRDGTPEAVRALIDKETPALTHALTAHSLSKTPFATMSRAITGIRQPGGHGSSGSLIITLPGSAKAVRECLEILLGSEGKNGFGLLLHALDLITGGSGKDVHSELQGETGGRDGKKHSEQSIPRARNDVATGTDTGHAHHHHHSQHDHAHHHAPRPRTTQSTHKGAFVTRDPVGVADRHRQSPYPILSLSEALSLIDQHTDSPQETSSSMSKFVKVAPVSSALSWNILAEDIRALRDLPPGPTTNVDGYAVLAAKTPAGVYDVLTLETLSARGSSEQIKAGKEIFRINTGQGLPDGTDAVVMVEDTQLPHEVSSTAEEKRIQILAQVDTGENVRPKGSDVRKGDIVLRKGTLISPLGGEIGTLAFLGRTEVHVYRRPKIALLSTGNELVDLSQPAEQTTPWGFNVYDANRPGLRAAIEGQGFDVIDLGIVGDDSDATLAALRKGLEEAEIVISTGGTSMGESDLLKPIIERELQGTIHFGRVAMKPGKPTTFATVASRSIFALPGNPASALVCFYVFVLPALRKMAGYPPRTGAEKESNPWSLPRVRVRLAQQMRLDPRPEFHRAVLQAGGGTLTAHSTGSQRSSGMHSMATANALVCVPALQPHATRKYLEAGEEAEAIILGALV